MARKQTLVGEQDGSGKRARLRREIEARGVDPVFADGVLARVELVSDASPESWAAIVDGVEMAYRVHLSGRKDAQPPLQDTTQQNLRDLAELSRLMEDFGGELRKLDETLKILAAYLGRMRKQVGQDAATVVH